MVGAVTRRRHENSRVFPSTNFDSQFAKLEKLQHIRMGFTRTILMDLYLKTDCETSTREVSGFAGNLLPLVRANSMPSPALPFAHQCRVIGKSSRTVFSLPVILTSPSNACGSHIPKPRPLVSNPRRKRG